MSELPPPKSLHRQRDVVLTNAFFSWDEGPLFLGMPRTTALYIPCFTKLMDLHAVLGRMRSIGYTVKIIEDGLDFFENLPTTVDGRLIHVILDPYYTTTGTLRFTQVIGGS